MPQTRKTLFQSASKKLTEGKNCIIQVVAASTDDGIYQSIINAKYLKKLEKAVTKLEKVILMLNVNASIEETERTVEITVMNMKGKSGHVETVPFTDFPALKQRVKEILDQKTWRRVAVELVPSWEATKKEQKELDKIETEE